MTEDKRISITLTPEQRAAITKVVGRCNGDLLDLSVEELEERIAPSLVLRGGSVFEPESMPLDSGPADAVVAPQELEGGAYIEPDLGTDSGSGNESYSANRQIPQGLGEPEPVTGDLDALGRPPEE